MSEPVFVDGTVVGQLDDGVFKQVIYPRHIYRVRNAKGMDVGLYESLKGRCSRWMLTFGDTLKVLSIPFPDIEIFGKKMKPGKNMEPQYMVPLTKFNQEQTELQRRMM